HRLRQAGAGPAPAAHRRAARVLLRGGRHLRLPGRARPDPNHPPGGDERRPAARGLRQDGQLQRHRRPPHRGELARALAGNGGKKAGEGGPTREDFGRPSGSATVRGVAQNGIAAKSSWALGAIAGLGMVWGCASTEFFNEGPGQPTDRASGEVPPGSIGACKLPLAKRPPIVNEKLWEDVRICTSRTPESYIRLGYGAGFGGAATDADADKNMERYFTALRDGQKE